jgi:hypothetical protein
MIGIRARHRVIEVVLCASLAMVGRAARAADAPSAAAGSAEMIPGIPGGPPLIKGETPEETYQLNFVGLVHQETGGYQTPHGYMAKTETWWGVRGKYKLRLGPIEFYDAVARSDLHDKAKTRVILTASCLVAGAGLAVGGAIYAFSHANSSSPPTGGILAIMGGAALIFVAVQLRFETVPEAEAYKMARIYNDRLRAQLGLPPIVEDPTQPEASSPRARPRQRRVSFVPALAPDGGGLLVVGSF